MEGGYKTMSTDIETKIVEMRFDNEQFAKGVQDTLKDLENLKKSLNIEDSAKSFYLLDKAAQSVKLDGLVSGVDYLTKRFSNLGIVAMTVVQNITNSLIDMTKKGVNFLTQSIVSGGIKRSMNIENAHFQLQALLKDEEKVQEIMDQAMESVDGTAYAYDEAAKAASMFAASGIQAGEQMMQSLSGITGVAAMTNSAYEDISRIFTTVAGNGRLMGDQLLQLSARGLNAASTISDYFKEVLNLTDTTESEIRDMVSRGEISFDIFASAMNWAFGDSAKRANETFTGAFSNMKSALARIGAEFVSPLVEQNSEVVKLFNVLRTRINDVKSELTFKDSENGLRSLSTQFTDFALQSAMALSDFVQNLNITPAFQVFYSGVESSKNVLKGFLSILKPIGTALRDVFFKDLDSSKIVDLAKQIETLTSKLKLSEKNSKNLHDGLEGIFSVAKLISKILLKLVKAIVPVVSTSGSLLDVVLLLIGSIGRLLTGITDWITQDDLLRAGFNLLLTVLSSLVKGVIESVKWIDKMVNELYEMEEVRKIISAFNKTFKMMINTGESLIRKYIGDLDGFIEVIKELGPGLVTGGLTLLIKSLEKLGAIIEALTGIKFDNLTNGISEIGSESEKSNRGISKFSNSIQVMSQTLSHDNLEKIVNKSTDAIKRFIAVITEDISLSGVIGIAAGIGSLVTLFKMFDTIKALQGGSISAVAKSLSGTLNELTLTLKSYQNDIRADAILKISGAIGILAASIVALSYVPVKKLLSVTLILGIFAAGMLLLINKLLDVSMKGKSASDALYAFSKRLGKAINGISRSVEISAIGVLVGIISSSILKIAVAIAAITAMYSKYPAEMDKAVALVGVITIALGGIILMMETMAGKGSSIITNIKTIGTIALSVLALSVSIRMIVGSVVKLMSMELPNDWAKRLIILGSIIGGVALLAVAIGAANMVMGKESGSISAVSIVALALSVTIIVNALSNLFSMDIPNDWIKRMAILAGIFAALLGVITVMSLVSALGGKANQSALAILAMAVAISSIVLALSILSLFPVDKMLKGAVSLGLVLLALGVAVGAAGAISKGNKSSWQTVLAMAVDIVAIVVALSVLSMISWGNLMKGVVALGTVLLALAANFLAVSKITNEKIYAAIISMTVALGVIALSLLVLGMVDWNKILASGTAISMILLSLGTSMQLISKSSIDLKQMAAFAEGVAAIVAIAFSLTLLQGMAWETLVASGIAISAILLAISGAMFIISAAKPNLTAMLSFAEAVIGIIGIAYSISMLASYPADQVLAAASAITEVLLAISATMLVATVVGLAAPAAAAGLLLIVAFIAGFAALLAALGAIFSSEDAKNLLNGGIEALKLIGEGIGQFIGSIVGGVLEGISDALPVLGQNLSEFADNAKPFFDAVNSIDAQTANGVKYLAEAILILTAADLIDGIVSFFGGGESSLADFGQELADMADPIKEYADKVAGIDAGSVQASAIAIKCIAEAADALPKKGGLWQKLTGEGSLGEFAKDLSDLAPSIVDYSISAENINPDAIKASSEAISTIVDIAKNLPKHGGYWQKLTGDSTLASFAEELIALAPKLLTYGLYMRVVDVDSINRSTEVIDALVSVANSIGNSGGFVSLFTGDNTLSDFGEELVEFAPNLVDFSKDAANVKFNACKNAAEVIGVLIESISDIPNSGGWVSLFSGDNNISDFGKDLKKLGEGLKGFSDEVSETSQKDVKNAADNLKIIVNAIKNVNDMGKKNVNDFIDAFSESSSNCVTKFVSGFQNGAKRVRNSIIGFIDNNVSAVRDAAPNLYSVASDVGDNTVDTFEEHMPESEMYNIGYNGSTSLTAGIFDVRDNLYATADELGTGTVQTLSDSMPSGTMQGIGSTAVNNVSSGMTNASGTLDSNSSEIGKAAVGSLASGISSNSGSVSTAISTITSRAKTDLTNGIPYSATYGIGSNAIKGFINGMASGSGDIGKTVKSITSSVIEKFKKGLDERSPSHILDEIGTLGMAGFINGIIKKKDDAENAANDITSTVIGAVTNTVSEMSRIMEEDPNFSPTITPVLDTSSIARQFNDFNSRFQNNLNVGTTYGLAMTASAGAERTISNRSNPQANGLKDIRNAISSIPSGTSNNFNNQFYITGNDPKAIADEVSMRIQKQVDRRDRVWA